MNGDQNVTIQMKFRMPATGDIWRHYKGDLYTVIGISRDHTGRAIVVYTDFDWQLAQLAPIYNQPLGRFLQEIENGTPRLAFVGDSADPLYSHNRCQFIDWAEVGRDPSNDERKHARELAEVMTRNGRLMAAMQIVRSNITDQNSLDIIDKVLKGE